MQRPFLLACLFALHAAAQQHPFGSYTPKDGLVNSRVRKAYQDGKGRLYFCTYGGLSVYDGARFKNYTAENGLAFNLVNDVLQVGPDSLLVAVNTSRLHTLVRGRLADFKTADGFYPLTNQLLKTSNGTLYALADDGLFRLRNHRFEKLFPITATEEGFFGEGVEWGRYLVLAQNDLRDYKGLYLFDTATKRLTHSLPSVSVYHLAKDAQGHVWLCLTDKVRRLHPDSLAHGLLRIDGETRLPSPAFNYPIDLLFNGQSAWINADGKAVLRNGSGPALRLPLPEMKTHAGMRSLFVDAEKNLWVCNDGAGVYKFTQPGLSLQQPRPGEAVLAVNVVGDGIFYSTQSKSLLVKNKSGALRPVPTNLERSPNVIAQRGGRLLAYDTKHLYEADFSDAATALHFRTLAALPGGDYFGKSPVMDAHGACLMPMSKGIGVWRNGQMIFSCSFPSEDYTEKLAFDVQGNLWVATRYRGLLRFSVHPETPSRYLQLRDSFPGLLQNGSPRSMVIDANGTVWVGTRSHGLSAFTYRNGKLQKAFAFTRSNGLTDDFVTALFTDGEGNVLVGTQSGLDRLVKQGDDYYVQNLTKSNGLFCFIPQVWANNDGSAEAITDRGERLLVPPPSSPKNFQPQLFISEMRMNGQAITDGSSSFVHNQNNLSLQLAAPSFADEGSVRFAYRLHGTGNPTWSDTTANAGINLVNLAPGNYELEVKALFPSTGYAEKSLRYQFQIKPPWWQTVAARAGGGLLLILVAGLFVRSYYRRKLQGQRMVLERQQAVERERTRIATDMHDDLGAGLSRIKFLSENMEWKTQQGQAIEGDLGKIKTYSHQMIDKMGEIVWALNQKNDTLPDLIAYTRAYAADYLEQYGIACCVASPDEIPPLFISGEVRRNVFLSVKEALHNVVKHAGANEVKVSFTVDKRLLIEIEDNGKGFLNAQRPGFGNGLPSIRQRMEAVGGVAEIISENGTSVRLSVPLLH